MFLIFQSKSIFFVKLWYNFKFEDFFMKKIEFKLYRLLSHFSPLRPHLKAHLLHIPICYLEFYFYNAYIIDTCHFSTLSFIQ